jgi:hypothetical protein
MSEIDQTLQRLGVSFTVRDIMVPKERLVCVTVEADAPQTSERNPDYNVIPIEDNGALKSLYERDSQKPRPIAIQDLVGSDTSIMDLVEILSSREFCFALVGNEIGGYVHFSDLNNPLVKLTFYVVFEAVERHLLAAIHPVTEQAIEQDLGLGQLNRIRKEVQKAQTDRANLSLENFLYLPQILGIAVAEHKLLLDNNQIQSIRMFRNRVSHAGWPLIQKHGDVKTLIEAKKICLDVLNGAIPAIST